MKKIIALFALSLIGINSFAQVIAFESKKIPLSRVKSTTTIVPISKQTPQEVRQQFVEVFEKYWTISPTKVVDFEEFSNYAESPEYTFLAPYVESLVYGGYSQKLEMRLSFHTYLPNKKKPKMEELGAIHIDV